MLAELSAELGRFWGGNEHWQESFNDPERHVKLFLDFDATCGDEADLARRKSALLLIKRSDKIEA